MGKEYMEFQLFDSSDFGRTWSGPKIEANKHLPVIETKALDALKLELEKCHDMHKDECRRNVEMELQLKAEREKVSLLREALGMVDAVGMSDPYSGYVKQALEKLESMEAE